MYNHTICFGYNQIFILSYLKIINILTFKFKKNYIVSFNVFDNYFSTVIKFLNILKILEANYSREAFLREAFPKEAFSKEAFSREAFSKGGLF